MARYLCRVMTDTGAVVDEVFQAENREELLISFQSRKFHPIQIEEERKGIGSTQIGGKKLKAKSLILFCRQMATLLRSGVPLIKCFDIIASQTDDKVFKNTLNSISADVQAGSLMSAAIEKQGELFPGMLSKMVEVGEATGDLAKIMDRMAGQYESDDRIKKKVKGAMIYPLALICIAIGACIFMLIAVVPRFVDVFNSLNTELPLLTRILLACSNFITKRWYVVILMIPAIVICIIRVFRTEKVTRWVDRQLLTLRVIRGPMQKMMCASFARTLHTLIASGIPIVQAMEYTNQNIKNTMAQDGIKEITIGIQKGKGISQQMAQYPYFPNLLVSMISIGEASGNLEEMLQKTADYYDDELDAAISQLTTIIEPVMILFVGLLIGGIVMALYAPMFGVISAMSGSL